MNVKDTTTAKSNLQNKSVLKVCRSGELNSPCRYGEVSVSMKILKWRTTQNDAQYQIPGAYPVMVVQVYINRLIPGTKRNVDDGHGMARSTRLPNHLN
jgi:hypothetical protein